MISKTELKKLKKKLPKGAAAKIKKRLMEDYEIDVTDKYINLVLNGVRNNDHIIQAAIEEAKKFQEELKKTKAVIDDI